MIAVEGVTKRFGDVVAVDDLSFAVDEGMLFAFLGTNGAGKTTTISCMTTLLEPDAGRIEVNGHTVGRDDLTIRRSIGIVFQQSLLDPLLTARENLELRAGFYGIGQKRVVELAELIDITEFLDRRYEVLSGGEKRRVDIARALIHQPRTLFLDEPTTGLDPASREQVWQAITELRQRLGLTVLLTTHYMPETEAADHVLVIDHGRELASGTPMQLKAAHSSPLLSLGVNAHTRAEVLAAVDRAVPGAAWIEKGGSVHVRLADAKAARAVLVALGDGLGDVELHQGTMDDVFLALTSRARAISEDYGIDVSPRGTLS